MQNVKYQIFISSTYTDLKDERDQVIKACLEMGHIPVGMEMFSAADEEQWKIITRQIDESDYYVIIIAHRYGSVVDGISYTEKEYDYAMEKRVPALGFIVQDNAPWPADRVETEPDNRLKLEAFKQKIKLKPVKFWASKEELHSQCAISLMKTFNTQPRPGWVRSPEMAGPEIMAELSRLSSENAKLREEVAELKIEPDTSNLAQGEDVLTLHFSTYVKYSGPAVLELKTTWNALFFIIAGRIMHNPYESDIPDILKSHFYSDLVKVYNQMDSESRAYMSEYNLNSSDLVTIKTQFMALGLIKASSINIKRGVINVWKLTTKAENLYMSLAAVRRQ